MPCLNEAQTLGECIRDARKFLQKKHIVGEILVVDNGSIDGSAEIAERLGARVVSERRRGYGRALRSGFLAAKGEYIIMGDCDRTYDFRHMSKMWHLMQGADLVVGDRFKGKREKGATSLAHRLGVRALSWLARKRFGTDVYDFHCGIRGMRRSAISKLKFRTIGMEFATEMIAKAARAGLKIEQLPVDYRKSVKGRRPKLNTIRDGFRHLDYILIGEYRPFWRSFWRVTGILLASVILGVGLLWAVAQIPNSAIRRQSLASTEYLLRPNPRPKLIEGIEGSRMDLHSDAVLVSVANSYDGSFRSIIESKFAFLFDSAQCDNLRLQLNDELGANRGRAEHWYGVMLFVRPLLLLLNLQQIYILNGLAIVGLGIAIIVLLCRKKEFVGALLYALSFLIYSFFFGAISLRAAPVIIIAELATILAMRAVWDKKREQLPYLMLLAGVATNFFDLASAETLSLTLPLLMVLWLRRKNLRNVRFLSSSIIWWGLGFFMMWLARILLAWICLGNVFMMGLVDQFRAQYLAGNSLSLILNALRLNCVWVLVLAVLIVVLIIIFRRKKINHIWVVSVVALALIPLLRVVVMPRSLASNYYFAFRAFAASFLALMMLFARLINWRRFKRPRH